jgi:hypothetical protein
MTRTTISVLAALMLGGASVAYAGGAGKSTSDQTQNPARSEAGSSGSGTTSGMSAGGSSSSGSSTMAPGTTSGSSAGTSGTAAGSASQMSATDIEAKLEKQGYTQISGVKKVGDKFEAKAMKNGKAVNVEVDPATGMVKDKS